MFAKGNQIIQVIFLKKIIKIKYSFNCDFKLTYKKKLFNWLGKNINNQL